MSLKAVSRQTPYNGATRVREFKQMMKTFHENGIRVILDVVYNHTGQTEDSNFNQLVPDYYYRKKPDGSWSDAAACGNETASDREMMRRYMIESVKYWATEYHMDGFRFDLMGIHDIETMNAITDALHEIDPTIFVYGEGWTAGSSPLPKEDQALKANAPKLTAVAAFSDDLRDGLKGSVFEHEEGGFVSQEKGLRESIKFGVVGATEHPQIDYAAVNYSDSYWANSPLQCINYVSCHDNHTLYDKLVLSRPAASPEAIKKMHKLAQTIVLTSQGVPFLHAGTEFMRTKNGVENSYNSSDEINKINWDGKKTHEDVFAYYQGLIQLRKNHPAFRMQTTKEVMKHLTFLDYPGENFLAYRIADHANKDSWKNILVLLNGSELNKTIKLPTGQWTLVVDGQDVDEKGLTDVNATVTIPAMTAFVLKQD
jgi:pullulanase